jgi:hypothetical protein
MRVLSLLAVALAGCYDPVFDDCQFTCPDNRCPDGLACMAGVCRTPGASGTCACPDPPSGCSLVVNTAGACLASCSSAMTWDAAKSACAATPPWHLAVLDTPSTLSAGENALRAATTWIGLNRGTTGVDWRWITGGGTVAPLAPDWASATTMHGGGSLFTCAGLAGGKLYADACGTAYGFACTAN